MSTDIEQDKERADNVISLIRNKGKPIAISDPIERRRLAEEADDQITGFLREMNEKYAFIDSVGSKPMVLSKVYNEVYGKKIYEFISPEAIKLIHNNVMVDATTRGGKDSLKTKGEWWLAHSDRRTYDTCTFEPEKAPGEQYENGIATFNMWEGLAIEPKQGNWKKTCKHIYTILCNKDRTKFKYVMRWFAYAVQYPGRPAQVALIFKGKKGTGKGVILQSMARLFGRHGLVVANREHLTGKFNQHLEYATYLYADEAYYPGDKEVEGVLKNLITEPTIAVEAKFRSLKISRNCLHIVMSTNNDWVIPATEDERRYFINEIDNKYAKGESGSVNRDNYFDDIWGEMQGEGIRAMLYDLQNMKLGTWTPKKNVPVTSEMKKQIKLSLSKTKFAVFELLDHGIFPGALNFKGEYTVTSKNLIRYVHGLDDSYKTITSRGLIDFLKEFGVTLTRTNKARLYVFPELDVLRDYWIKYVSDEGSWDLSEKWTIETMTEQEY